MTQRATFKLDIAINQGVSNDLSSSKDSLAITKTLDLLSGTGADQASKTFHDSRTLSASSSEDLDLSGSLSDVFGNTIAFTGIKAIYIEAAAANGDNLEIGGASSAGFVSWVGDTDDVIVIPPGGFMLLGRSDASGWAVTATSADLLKIANADSGDSATYKIILVGIE